MKNKRKMFALIIVLASLGILALIFTDKASGEKGKLGLGANWPEVQVRYGQLKFKVQSGALIKTILALRGYFPIAKIPVEALSFNPYWGIEGGCIPPSYLPLYLAHLAGGFETGGFAGLEVEFNKNVKLNANIGLYLVDIRGKGMDVGMITSLGVYYYF